MRSWTPSGASHDVRFDYDELDWSCERYLREGAMMPADGLERVRHHDALLLGAVGAPEVVSNPTNWAGYTKHSPLSPPTGG
ncbi:MAG: hypothetical protein J2P19_32750 [Pseudonocardia sp.]|nr:hypothetical protein [Pseudonocardia sp.]